MTENKLEALAKHMAITSMGCSQEAADNGVLLHELIDQILPIANLAITACENNDKNLAKSLFADMSIKINKSDELMNNIIENHFHIENELKNILTKTRKLLEAIPLSSSPTDDKTSTNGDQNDQ